MKLDKIFSKPFHLFLALFYITLCLGTFLLENNDNVHNAYLFFVFILVALLGQSRSLNYKYLVGGGEKIWDKHAKKGLFFGGKHFELINDHHFYLERYEHVKNVKIDNLRRFFSYFMLAAYFLILYLMGGLSHSFLNVVPVLVCFAIIKATYLGHYLIPLLLNIAGVAYIYIQYNLSIDGLTIVYIFLVFLLLIFYRKIEQEQNLHGTSYFEKQNLWSSNEKWQMLKNASLLTLLFCLILFLSLLFLPSNWGTHSDALNEKTQIKAQRIATMARQYLLTPKWLGKDRSDTGAPVKEFTDDQGEQISSGEEEENGQEGKSLEFTKEEGREFPVSKGMAENDKKGLNLNKAEKSQNISHLAEGQVKKDDKGEEASGEKGDDSGSSKEGSGDQAGSPPPPSPPGQNGDASAQGNNPAPGDKESQGKTGSDGKNSSKESESSQGQSKGESGGKNNDPTPTPTPTPPPSSPPPPPPPPPAEDPFPWTWILFFILLLLSGIAYLIYRRYFARKEVILNDLLLESLKADWKKLRSVKMNPNEEVVVYYNFFQKVANHVVSGASTKLPPTLYAQILSEKFPHLRLPLEILTQHFSDVFYGELTISDENLKKYKQTLNKIFDFFHFK